MKVGKSHVNIFELIRTLKEEDNRLKAERLQLDMGHPARPMRKKFRVANERLMGLVDDLEVSRIDLVTYVRRVA